MYTNPDAGLQVSGDDKARRLVMLINDFVVLEDESDRSRLWLRQVSDLLTLLVMLRFTIYTRIKGDAGLRQQRLAMVPVGFVGDEELLSYLSSDEQHTVVPQTIEDLPEFSNRSTHRLQAVIHRSTQELAVN